MVNSPECIPQDRKNGNQHRKYTTEWTVICDVSTDRTNKTPQYLNSAKHLYIKDTQDFLFIAYPEIKKELCIPVLI